MGSSASNRREARPRSQLEDIAAAFIEEVRRGESVSIDEMARAHPEHSAEIRELFPAIRALESAGSRPPSGAGPGSYPERIGEYRVLGELGRGGMGVVLLAEQASMSRKVALKLLPPQASLDRHFLDRFRREARVAGRLQHPNIVQVFGIGEDDGLHFFAMQYIEGDGLDRVLRALRSASPDEVPGSESGSSSTTRTARALIERELTPGGAVPREPAAASAGSREPEGPLPDTPLESARRSIYFRNVARIGLQASEALAHAHSHGVLHRDVKPGNLLLDGEGRTWITDFGLCRPEEEGDLSGSRDVLGTLRYMAPEQLRGRADVRSDVYGLGCTLYELLTLRAPFDGVDRARLMHRVLNAYPARPRKLARDVPRDLEAIALKAMGKLPEERYGTARALANDLAAFLENRPVSARIPSALHLARLALRRNRLASTTALAAILALLTLTVLYVGGLRDAREEATRQVYLASMAAADSALRIHSTTDARRRLEAAPTEFRRWEWFHFQSRLDESLRIVASYDSPANAAAYSPRGDLLAVGTSGSLHLVDAVSAAPVWSSGDDLRIVDVDFGPEGRRVVAADSRQAVRILQRAGEEWRLETLPLSTTAYAVRFHPDGTRFAVGLLDATIRVFDSESGEQELVLAGSEGRVFCLDYTPAGDLLVAGSLDGSLRVWDVEREDSLAWRAHEGEVRCVRVAPAGDRFVSGSSDGSLALWDIHTGAELSRLRGHTDRVEGVVFTPDGSRLISSSVDRTIRIWDLASGRELRALSGSAGIVSDLAIHPDGERFVSASLEGAVREWDVDASGGLSLLQGHVMDVWDLAFDGDGGRLASGGRDCTVRVWDTLTGRVERVLIGHERGVNAVSLSASGERLASGDWGGWIRIWDVASGRELLCLPGEARDTFDASDTVGDLVLGVAGERLFVACESGDVEVWALAGSGRRTQRVAGPARASALALDEERGFLVAGYGDGTVSILSLPALDLVSQWRPHSEAVTAVDLHRSDDLVASVSLDGTLVLWDFRRQEQRAVLRGEEPQARSNALGLEGVVFFDDDQRLATASRSSVITIWDPLRHEEEIVGLHGHRLAVAALTSTSDGRSLASASWGGEIRVWGTNDVGARRDELREERGFRRTAEPLIAALIDEYGNQDALLDSIEQQVGLDADLRESMRALAHRARGGSDSLYQRSRRIVLSADRSAEDYRRAFRIAAGLAHGDGGNAHFSMARGAALVRCGHPDRGVPFLELARGLGGLGDDAPLLSAFLALAYARLDRREEALAELERAQTAIRQGAVPEPGVRALIREAGDGVRGLSR